MKKMVAANWKMHKTCTEAQQLLHDLDIPLRSIPGDREVAIFPPFTALFVCSKILPTGIYLGAQNCSYKKEGPFTGEVSPTMLKDIGCHKVLLGHSERRILFHENNSILQKKINIALEEGLEVIMCIGETLVERENDQIYTVLIQQLSILPEILTNVSQQICIAYEPVWAIGTGKVAGQKEIIEAHSIIRNSLIDKYGLEGKDIRILYGGGVKANNIKDIIKIENVDGVLVGNASMNVETFKKIIFDW